MRTLSLSLLMTGLFACASFAHADGLADMRAALAQLKGQSPIKAVLEAHSWHRTGEGKAADEEQGQASVGLEDAGRGLQVTYGRDLTARIDTEQRSRVRDLHCVRGRRLHVDIREIRRLAVRHLVQPHEPPVPAEGSATLTFRSSSRARPKPSSHVAPLS